MSTQPVDLQTARPVEWSFLGSVPYRQAAALQVELRERLRRGDGAEVLLLLEHPHVYTLGRNARHDDVLAGKDWLTARGAEVVECDRGGQVTYHGPGQLVGYPIIDLDPDRRDVRRYVHDLQEVLVRTLADCGISAIARREAAEIGVWVGSRKIASLGVHISRWLTTHGFALNLSTDLSYFSAIVPCGLTGVEMTSIQELGGRAVDLSELATLCAGHFFAVFDRRGEHVPAVQLMAPWPTVS